MKIRALLLIGWALCLTVTSSAQSYLQDTIPETVVTATGTLHLLKDVPVQTEVISGRMLENYAGRSLEDILSGLTSAFAFNEDDMGSHMQLGGLGNSYILILIDGKRIHGSSRALHPPSTAATPSPASSTSSRASTAKKGCCWKTARATALTTTSASTTPLA